MNLRDIQQALRGGAREDLLKCAKDPATWERIRSYGFLARFIEHLKNEGHLYEDKPIEALYYSNYKKIDQTGSRLEGEHDYFQHRKRLTTFGLLAILYRDNEKYLNHLQDIIWAICDEFTWALPAHLGTASRKNPKKPCLDDDGFVVSVPEHQRTYVDLFAAETAFALAEILYLLEDRIDDIVKYRARSEIFERVLTPFIENRYVCPWEVIDNNWAAVCAGSVGAAALYLVKDHRILSSILMRILEALDLYRSGFDKDGTCTEGMIYWTYGFSFYTFFSDLLKARTGGAINLFDYPTVRELMKFPQKCALYQNYFVSFADSFHFEETPRFGLMHYLKNINPDVEVCDIDYEINTVTDHCGRWPLSLRNFLWVNPDYIHNSWKSASHAMKNAMWFISRQDTGITFAAKGGHNAEPHNHNDIGNFILHAKGDNLLTDLGAGVYNKKYFSEKRYDFFCACSRGHSVPLINGRPQRPGRQYKGENFTTHQSSETDIVSLDLHRAYDTDYLALLNRTFKFNKINLSLTIIDTYKFTRAPESITERFITQASVEVHDGCGAEYSDGADAESYEGSARSCGAQAAGSWGAVGARGPGVSGTAGGSDSPGASPVSAGSRISNAPGIPGKSGKFVSISGKNSSASIFYDPSLFKPQISHELFTNHSGQDEDVTVIDFMALKPACEMIAEFRIEVIK